MQIVLRVIVESVIVVDLLQSLLDIRLFEQLPEVFLGLQALLALSHLLLLLVFSFQLVVPMLLLERVQFHSLCHEGQLFRDLLGNCQFFT